MRDTDRSSTQRQPSTAEHVIAGFRYQLLQSLAALLSLSQAESLLLEISEDFSVSAPGVFVDHQVKNSQVAAGPPSLSLQSQQVKDALSRFWNTEGDPAAERRLVFMARGGAAKEREFDFPDGQPGLHYWRAAALDGDTGPIRAALRMIFAGQPIGEWIEGNPSDGELRESLLRRVDWQLNQLSADDLTIQIKDQLRPFFHSRGLPVSQAGNATKLLMATLLISTES